MVLKAEPVVPQAKPPTAVNRQLQTRKFPRDSKIVLKAAIGSLQDLDYTIDVLNSDIGLITASRTTEEKKADVSPDTAPVDASVNPEEAGKKDWVTGCVSALMIGLVVGIFAVVLGNIFRGSDNDLVDRYYQAAKGKNITHILRLPADNPIPDPSEYNRLINYHLKTDNDFSSNLCNFMRNGYPDGFGVDIFTVNSLKKIWKNEKRKKFREHIALNFYDYKKDKKNLKINFKIGTVKCPKKISRPKLVFEINYYKDYLFIKQIYEYFLPQKKFFTATDVVKWYEKKYYRKELN